jgi:hypothetical protein
MPGGYNPPTPGDVGWLVDQLASLTRRIETLEQPSGEQQALVIDRVVTLENGEASNDELINGLSLLISEVSLRVATLENTSLDLERAAGAGFILRSPDGTRWRLGVSDAGASEWVAVV